MLSLPAALRPNLHPVPGLWLAALLIGCTPIVQSSIGSLPFVTSEQHSFSASPADQALLALTALTRASRASAADHLANHGPRKPQAPATRTPWLAQLLSLRDLMSDADRDELERIEKDWISLQDALSRGALSAPESFARHTLLLNRQLALQSSLRSAGL